MGLKSINRAITTTCILGILVSTYAFYVEMVVEAHPEYEAMCDLAEYASCSRVLTSEYSKGFGMSAPDSSYSIPNCIYGIAFYCFVIFLATFEHVQIARLLLLCAATSVAGCVYLAYILAFVLHDICVVCISTYVVNAVLLYFAFKKLKFLNYKKK